MLPYLLVPSIPLEQLLLIQVPQMHLLEDAQKEEEKSKRAETERK